MTRVDSGSITVVMAGVMACLLVVTAACMTAGRIGIAHEQLVHATDAAALAAADTALGHYSGDPCDNAKQLLNRMDYFLESCRVDGVTVFIATSSQGPVARLSEHAVAGLPVLKRIT